MEQQPSPPNALIVPDEMRELLAKTGNPARAVQAEAAHHGLTTRKLLNTLVRQSRIPINAGPRPIRLPFTAHYMSDSDSSAGGR